MKAVITVIGLDTKGIIYKVTKVLFEQGINVEDITQTVLQGYFTMVMLVKSTDGINIKELSDKFEHLREEGLSIRIQKSEIFDVMHKVDM